MAVIGRYASPIPSLSGIPGSSLIEEPAGTLAWRKLYSAETRYLDTAGDDADDGQTSGTAWQSLQRASQHNWGPGGTLVIAAGTYKRPDWGSNTGQRTVFGSKDSYLRIEGATSVATSFTVLSTSGIDVTASGSPGWTPGEHVGRYIHQSAFGLVFRHPIIANTNDTLTVQYAPTTVGGYLPEISGAVDIISLDVTIASPDTNPNTYWNDFYAHGSLWIIDVAFDGGGRCINSLTPGCDLILDGVICKNAALGGISLTGRANVRGCYIKDCGSAGLEAVGPGFTVVHGIAVDGATYGLTASFTHSLNTNSLISIENTTYGCFAKTRGVFNDESVRFRALSVQDWIYTIRDAAYLKLTAPLIGISGADSVSGHVVRLADPGNNAYLYNSSSWSITPGAGYINLDGESISEADYIAAGRSVEGPGGNFVRG